MNNKTVKITITAVMAAIGTIIYMLFPEIPLIPASQYLKMDFSDIPAIITSVLIGPLWGIMVEVIKNIIHLTRTTTFGIGELINVGMGTALSVSLIGFMRLFERLLKKNRFSFSVYIISAIATLIVAVISGWLLNAVFTPLYFAVTGIPITAKSVLAGVIGSTLLNVVKASLNILPFYPVYFALDKAFSKIYH